MTARTASGHEFVSRFDRNGGRRVLTGFDRPSFAAAKIVHERPNFGLLDVPPQDAFVLSFMLSPFAAGQLWVGGRAAVWQPIRKGEVRFYDLQEGVRAEVNDPLNFLFFYLPRKLLNQFADEHHLPMVDGCRISTGTIFSDPIVADLACSVLPKLETAPDASELFMDEIALKLQIHFVRAYAKLTDTKSYFRGGLAPHHEQRVKDYIRAHLDGAVTIAELAAECQISRSQFFRAFLRTTGLTPHQWLSRTRIDQARHLLLCSNLSLNEISERCGFANQSHFTRTFARYFGVTPGAWRSSCRSQ